jgi:hypothetical protein
MRDRRHLYAISIVGFLFICLIAWPLYSAAHVPGTLRDTRFNMFVLEHLYRRMVGKATSFASPDIFYPYPGTLFFSDTHAATAWIYAGFRYLGLSDYVAFTSWFLTGYVLTFAAAYYVFLRLNAGPWSAALGAGIFSFCLPSLAQYGHPQLVYRCCVPLAMLDLWLWLRQGTVGFLFRAVFWLNLELLMSVYLGVFLALLMAAFVLSALVLAPHRLRVLRALLNTRNYRFPFTIKFAAEFFAFAATSGLAAVILYQHYEVSKSYGLRPPWEEVRSMLPRPVSYFMSSQLPYYRSFSGLISANVPMPHEHNMFIGFGALGLFVAGLVGLARRSTGHLNRELILVTLSALILVSLMVTSIGHFSLYGVLAHLPGIAAIRAVTRIILVLMFPIALISIAGFEFLGSRKALGKGLAFALTFFMIYEVSASDKSTFSIMESEERLTPIVTAARERSAGISDPILAVDAPSGAADISASAVVEIDAMIAAQRLGWPTVNGYSGYTVPGAGLDCGTPRRQYTAYEDWSGASRPVIDINEMLRRTIFVGWPDCNANGAIDTGRTELQVGSSKAPDPTLPPLVQLSVSSLERRDDAVSFHVKIRNTSTDWLWQDSAAPLRLSWRFVPVGEIGTQVRGPAWAARQGIAGNIAPGTSQTDTIGTYLPREPGLYRLEVSLVAESLFWFHDQGMPVATFGEAIEVK